MKNQVGIFDSGIGGLTVAKEIHALFPTTKIIYFGDTAHLPYGDKSKEAIISYAKKIVAFLINEGCQHIVIACNTASAFAFESVKKQVYGKAFVYNVIDPVVNYVGQHYTNEKIGVIGTKGTIQSRIYPRKINRISKSLKVTSLATPLLAPMIEEGYFNNKISRTIIHSYLSRKEFKDVQALILACTHYPLIEHTIAEYYKNKVQIINSAKVVASEIRQKVGTELDAVKKQKHQFYVSDLTNTFSETAKMFFGADIKLRKKNIWS